MFYITGDTHGNFDRIIHYCQDHNLSQDDAMIILGDAGLNYHGDIRDTRLKRHISKIPITYFCIHGNHEMRPENIKTYHEKCWNGGVVYYEDEFPQILFAKDGEIFDIGNRQCIVIGGAYSVDKYYRLMMKYSWFSDEQPSDEIKCRVEEKLGETCWKIDTVLSHTCPLKYEPTEVFFDSIDQSEVDKSTETWLGTIESKLQYAHWYCAHFHTEKSIDKLRFLYKAIEIF